MTAGVPGLGLGGLFALFAALCLPMLRTSSRRGTFRLFAMALSIVVAALLAWQFVAWLYQVVTTGEAAAAPSTHVSAAEARSVPFLGELFGIPVILVSVLLLGVLLFAGEVLYRVLGVRPTPTPPAILPLGLEESVDSWDAELEFEAEELLLDESLRSGEWIEDAPVA